MRTEPLGKGVQIYVNGTHHFTTDTILLADFAKAKNGERIVELGTGCGTIPLLIIRDKTPKNITAVELQKEAIDLLQNSIKLNLENGIDRASLITPVHANLLDCKSILKSGESDLVVCNPPYKLSGSGIVNPDPSKKTARHESECSLDDICKAASWALRYGGRLCMCQRPERLCDIFEAMRANGIEPKRLRLVQGRADKAPKLVLCEGKRGAKRGYTEALPTLIIEDENGFTAEMKEIYGSYKENHNG